MHDILQELAQLVFMLFLIFMRTCKIILVQTTLYVATMLKKNNVGTKLKVFVWLLLAMNSLHSAAFYGVYIAVFVHAHFTLKYPYYKCWPVQSRKMMTLDCLL